MVGWMSTRLLQRARVQVASAGVKRMANRTLAMGWIGAENIRDFSLGLQALDKDGHGGLTPQTHEKGEGDIDKGHPFLQGSLLPPSPVDRRRPGQESCEPTVFVQPESDCSENWFESEYLLRWSQRC